MSSKKDLSMDEIKPADYNPRIISDPESNALDYSMKEFGDISGITWNRQTGNLVTGHQRYNRLVEKYGKLTFGRLINGRRDIISEGNVPTGYDLREVDWPEDKELAANLAANSHTNQGKWDLEAMPELLAKLEDDFATNLRLDMLAADLDIDLMAAGSGEESDSGGSWEPDEKTANVPEGDRRPPVKFMIKCRFEDQEDLVQAIRDMLAEADFEEVEILC
jgi:hypothetical protein